MSDWFTHNGVAMQWLQQSLKRKAAQCDSCDRVVWPDEARLRVDNNSGPARKSGRGKRHQYLCVGCGKDLIA